MVADTTWAALRGRAALDITWRPGPNAGYDSTAFREELVLEGARVLEDNGRGRLRVSVPAGWVNRAFFSLAHNHGVVLCGLGEMVSEVLHLMRFIDASGLRPAPFEVQPDVTAAVVSLLAGQPPRPAISDS